MTLAIDPAVNAAAPADASRATRALQVAKSVLETEANAIRSLGERLDRSFVDAVTLIGQCSGRVVVTGIGKSGHIGRKLAATFASTGTPAFFVHAAEVSHGDLGMIAPGDVVLMVSNSGESGELVSLVPHLQRRGAKLIALTGDARSSLARGADVHLDAAVSSEACPLGVAPSASTTAALALGDALAFALLDARGFSIDDFARSHPGGSLAKQLMCVRDIMRTGAMLPIVAADARLSQALDQMSAKGMGMTAVVDADGHLVGVFTDGDLRRCVDRYSDLSRLDVRDVMTRTPRTIAAERLAIECVDLMETPPKVMHLLVVDEHERLLGAVHMHDLFRARIV
jgi:arabinose-5-phosphate isomerase